MTEVKTFRAESMQEALDLVRREMGADAVILHTRQVTGKQLMPWQKPRTEVEITAGNGIHVRPLARTSSASAEQLQPAPVPRTVSSVPVQSESAAPQQPTASAQLLSELTRTLQAKESQAQPSVAHADLMQKLDTIQKMLEKLGRAPLQQRISELSPVEHQWFEELLKRDVPEELAEQLVMDYQPTESAAELDPEDQLIDLITQRLNCRGPITVTPGKRKVVALVGPTGVGKTTTIAKLAANFRIRQGVRMGLVTVDTYRIAAVEQLRTYADIIGLPMKVVTNPLEMKRALAELPNLDLVLIDTAGRSPRDELQLNELKSLLHEANVDEVHLVLSTTSSTGSLTSTLQKFEMIQPSGMILTKLDEATSLGNVVSLMENTSLPVSYLTTGQDVPDDIEPATTDRLARLILGADAVKV